MEESTTSFTGEFDISQQVLDRYGKSVKPQHRHLCETAEAIRTIIISESLPLTPLSYFTTIIDTSKTTSHDDDTVSVLSWFLEIVLPLVPDKSITMSKAADAVEIVVEGLQLQVSSVRASSLVGFLAVLLEFCDLEDWESVQLGFRTLLKFAIDKRPKVRKRAQDCIVKVFESFQSCIVQESASTLVLESCKTYMLLAVETVGSRPADGSKDDEVSKNLEEAVRMLDVLKILIPCLPSKLISEAIVELEKLLSAKFPPLTMHVLDVMEEMLGFIESESQITVINSVRIVSKWNSHYCSVIVSIAGLLTYEEATAKRASEILTKVIRRLGIYDDLDTYINVDFYGDADINEDADISEDVYINEDVDISEDAYFNEDAHFNEDADISEEANINEDADISEVACINEDAKSVESEELFRIVKALSGVLEKVLSTHNKGTPNEYVLAVINGLYHKLGRDSNTYMSGILEKLASFMTIASGDAKQRDYVVASSLELFIKAIVPLESFQEASQKVKDKKSVVREQLQSHARDCWGLLPAFCRHPRDTYENFGSLVKTLIPYIKEDEDVFMLEKIAIALQYLVKQNKNMSFLGDDEASKLPDLDFYDEETATRNIEALSSSSEDLLKAFIKVFFQVSSSPNKCAFVKDTIGCLALITESSIVNAIFISSLKRRKLNVTEILELASSFVSIDPTDLIYDFIKECLQEEDDNIQRDAYATLYKILVESSELRIKKFEQLVDLLLNLKSPVDITSLRWRFSCFKTLLLHSLETTRGGENTYGFRMLHEIIKDSMEETEEIRKVAYGILLETSSILQKTSSSPSKGGPYHVSITLIMRHISRPCPRIKSGAISALSLLISTDSKICDLMPDLVPAILELLETEGNIQVIEAVFGFLKVLVSSLQVRDLHNFLSDILNGLLPWSSVSQYHIESKVMFILEIIVQKCGAALVISLVPTKYRDFVENVLENRPSSREDVKVTAISNTTN